MRYPRRIGTRLTKSGEKVLFGITEQIKELYKEFVLQR
jgi:hypothetical protein